MREERLVHTGLAHNMVAIIENHIINNNFEIYSTQQEFARVAHPSIITGSRNLSHVLLNYEGINCFIAVM